MARLDIDRQKKLEPIRTRHAMRELGKLGLQPEQIGEATIIFQFKGETIRFYPYSGWHSGKTIKDGRGLLNLIKQLTPCATE